MKVCQVRSIGGGRVGLACLVMMIAYGTTAAAEEIIDLPSQVLTLFTKKCASCHDAKAKKEKLRYYITDLTKVAANPKIVVPSDLEKSKLWKTVDKGEMPIDDDENAIPLSDSEKKVIKDWIAAGAPTGNTAIATMSTQPAEAPAKKNFFRSMVHLVGELHPLAIHFPIALLMAAAMAEVCWVFTRNHWFTSAVRFSTILGALGAVGAAVLGWIDAIGHTSSDLLSTHRLFGTVAGIWAIPVMLLCEYGIRRIEAPDAHAAHVQWSGASRLLFQVSLLIGVGLISFAAHIGGLLLHGEDYLSLSFIFGK